MCGTFYQINICILLPDRLHLYCFCIVRYVALLVNVVHSLYCVWSWCFSETWYITVAIYIVYLSVWLSHILSLVFSCLSQVVVKFIRKSKIFSSNWWMDQDHGRLPLEIALLISLDHRNIVKVCFWLVTNCSQCVSYGLDHRNLVKVCP